MLAKNKNMQKQKFYSLALFLKRQLKKSSTDSVSNFKIIIFSLSIISLFSYLIVVNRTNTMGYELAEMQLKIRNLKATYRDLQSQTTELQSLPRIKEISNSSLNMVMADNFNYILPGKSSVAVKD